jgi:GTP pyrophosphokinase
MEENITFDDLLNEVKKYIKDETQLNTITEAYKYASTKHFGEKRLDGNDFINHPLNVAMILTELRSDYQTIATALLHEIVDFGHTPIEEVKDKFGEEISSLVNGPRNFILSFISSTEEFNIVLIS